MEETIVSPKAKVQFTDVIVGNAWTHTDAKGRVYINITISQDFEGKLVLVAGSALTLKAHTKRTGINPNTGKEYRDSDYMLTYEPA